MGPAEALRRVASNIRATNTTKVGAEYGDWPLDDVLDYSDLINFAEDWAKLGSAVQQQVKDVLGGNDDVNPKAIQMAIDSLAGHHNHLWEDLKEWMERVEADAQL